MEIKNILVLVGFMLFALLLAGFWDRKIKRDRKNRKQTARKTFFIFFGFIASFLTFDNWIIFSGNSKEYVSIKGLGGLYDWWGIYAFILGVFIGSILLSFLYRRLAQAVLRFNLLSFYEFFKIRYPHAKKFTAVMSKIPVITLTPLIYYQIKVIEVVLFPGLKHYFSVPLIALAFVLIFLYLGNKNLKVPFLTLGILMLVWIVFAFFNTEQQAATLYLSKPEPFLFLTLAFLGACYYLIMPRQFANYSYRKIESMQIGFLTRSLFLGSLAFFIVFFFVIPIGGWNFSKGMAGSVFVLILGFSVSLVQLFVMRTLFYSEFKKYKSSSKSIAGILSSVSFLVIIMLCSYLVEHFKLDYNRFYLLSLTYLPILVPSFVGGILAVRPSSLSYVLSYLSGFGAWIYLVVFEDLLGFKMGLPFEVGLIAESFIPFAVALVFYIVPAFFSKSKSLKVKSLSYMEDVVLESFLTKMDDSKLQKFFDNNNMLKVIMMFFDRKSKYFDFQYMLHASRLSPNRLEKILTELEADGWIIKKDDLYKYKAQEEELYNKMKTLIASYHNVESLFRKKVQEDFNEYKESVITKAQELDSQISTLTLLNEVSLELSRVFNFETLYKKVVELCINNLSFEGAELFLVEKKGESYHYKPLAIFFANYRHLMLSLDEYEDRIDRDLPRQRLYERAIVDQKLILNSPREIEGIESLLEPYCSFGVLPVFHENEPFALIHAGFSTGSQTVHTDAIQKLSFLANNFSQSIMIIKFYESLEDKINQRTAELRKTNDSLTEVNDQLNSLDKEIKREMVAASAIQKSIFPEHFPHEEIIDSAFLIKPMPDLSLTEKERESIQISGDYYDCFEIGGGKVGILIADVTGHGVPSALITTMAKILFYTHSTQGGSTADICKRVNNEIFLALGKGDTGFYITVFFSIYDIKSGKLQYTNAGHHPALISRFGVEDQLEKLDTDGFFIGSFDEAVYEYKETYLNEKDRLILYSDGIVEMKNPDEEFFEFLFYSLLVQTYDQEASVTKDLIYKKLEEFRNGRRIVDDRTLVIFRPLKIESPIQKDFDRGSVLKVEKKNIEIEQKELKEESREEISEKTQTITALEKEQSQNSSPDITEEKKPLNDEDLHEEESELEEVSSFSSKQESKKEYSIEALEKEEEESSDFTGENLEDAEKDQDAEESELTELENSNSKMQEEENQVNEASDKELKKELNSIVKIFNQKNYDEKIVSKIKKLLEKMPENALLYYMLGVIYSKSENYEIALDNLMKSYEYDSENVQMLNYLAFVFYKAEDYKNAALYWEKALAINPGLESARKNLAVIKKMI